MDWIFINNNKVIIWLLNACRDCEMFNIDVRLLGIVKGVLFVDIFEIALIDVFMVARKVNVVVVEIGLVVEVVMVLVVVVNFVVVVVVWQELSKIPLIQIL